MAVAIVGAAISTAGVALGLVAPIGGFLGMGLFGHFLVTTAMGAALNALTPKPKFSGASGPRGFSLRGESGAALDHQVIYGEARVGGARIYDASTGTNNQYLHRILAFAGHEVDSYQEIYLNDAKVVFGTVTTYSYVITYVVNFPDGGTETYTETYTSTADYPVGSITRDEFGEITGSYPSRWVSGTIDTKTVSSTQSNAITEVLLPDGTTSTQYNDYVRIKTYLGTTTQTADADLISETTGLTDGAWSADHRLQGIAYIYVRFKYDANAFPNGVPAVSAKIRGKKVYDPRTGTTAWSDNPALCIRDYLTNEYGLDQTPGRIDDTLVSTAANICDQTVEGEKRYTCNGSFTTGLEPSTIVTNLLTSMGGLLWYGQGKWRMKASAWSTPTVTFDEDDLRSGISLSTRHSRRDNFNAVKGTFAGDETDWQPTDYPEVTDAAFLAADNDLSNVLDFPLPFTSSSLTAQRIARIALNRNREQLTFSASFGMRAFQVQVGDFVYINNTRFGWTNKAFEVVEWTFGLTDGLDIQVNMTLREISQGVFTGADGSLFEQNNTTLPNPSFGLNIQNLTASGGGSTQGDGTFLSSVILDWDDVTSAFLDHYEVEWKVVTDSAYSSTTTEQSSIEIIPVVDGLLYDFRIRAVTVAGIKGPYSTIQFAGGGDQTAPGLPTNLSAVGGFEYITISWTNPADTDLNFVEIWESDTNNSAAATKIGVSGGDTFQRTNLGLSVTKWYFLKAVDYSGNASAFTTGVSATTTFLDDDDFANGIYSLFTEQGLYAIEDVTSLPVAGDFVGQKVFNRTDGKLYQWTGSAWELVVAQVNAPDINGQLQTAQIAVNAITNDLIAANAITETKISNDAITTPKIAAGAVTAGEIAAGAVTAVKIAADSITSDKIVSGTIQANDIATGTITATQIAGSTITGDKIVANTITGGLLATSGIITNSAQINNAVVTNAKIANLAVTTAKIADLNVTTLKIAGQAVSNTGAATGSLTSIPTSSWVILAQVTINTAGGNTVIVEGNATTVSGGAGGGGTPGDGNIRIRVGGTTLHTVGLVQDEASVALLGVGTSSSGTTTAYIEGSRGGGDGTFSASGRIVITELKK